MSETAPVAAPEPVGVTIKLEEPIVRPGEGNTITDLHLRKPKGGELRGLRLTDLMGGDIGSILTVLPRIATPHITDIEAENLSTEDLSEIGGQIVGFFMNQAQREMILKAAGL